MGLDFSTHMRSRTDRLDYWREMVCLHHVHVSPDYGAPDDFSGQMTIKEFGSVQLSDATFSPIAYTHGPNEVKRSNRNDMLCVLNLDGDGQFTQHGRTVPYAAGDLLIYDTDQIYSISFPTCARTISARMPRALVLSRIPHADRQFAVRLSGARPLTQLAAGFLSKAARMGSLPDGERCHETGNALVDILCTAVKDSLGETAVPTPGQAAVLARVKRQLVQQLGDSSLDVEGIATAQGVSPRTLNRMFAAEGTTVMRWIWEQRLAASYRALSDGSVRQVTEAAFRFGFKDTSHYTRAFRKEYNVPPRSLLSR